MAFLRFPIPEFDYKQFDGLNWEPPEYISSNEVERLTAARADGDAGALGAYAVSPDGALFEKLDVRGDHCHAVMCVLPDGDNHLLGRSYAWWNQRVWILDGFDAASANVVYDWHTPRPKNTRLGPDDGVTVPGGVYFVISGHMYDDHWLGNRTIIDSDWGGGDAAGGFRVLGASKDNANEFFDCCLSFSWND